MVIVIAVAVLNRLLQLGQALLDAWAREAPHRANFASALLLDIDATLDAPNVIRVAAFQSFNRIKYHRGVIQLLQRAETKHAQRLFCAWLLLLRLGLLQLLRLGLLQLLRLGRRCLGG